MLTEVVGEPIKCNALMRTAKTRCVRKFKPKKTAFQFSIWNIGACLLIYYVHAMHTTHTHSYIYSDILVICIVTFMIL